MHGINLQTIQGYTQDFEKEPIRKLAQNAISKTNLQDVILDRKTFQKHNHVYSHQIAKEGNPVTAQKSSGRCWLFAAMNAIRIPFAESINVEEFEFSQSYLFFWDKFEKSNYFLNSIIETRNEDVRSRVVMWMNSELISDGGQWDMFVNLVNKYGLVPKDAFPESFSSSSSAQMNWLLRHKLREFASQLRADPEKSIEELQALKEEQLNVIYRLLCTFLGTPPTEFDWSYRNKDKEFVNVTTTPQNFYEESVKPLFDVEDMVCLINAPTQDKPFNKLFTVQYLGNISEGYPIRYINVPIEELKRVTKEQIADGSPVWFGCDVGKWHTRELGILDPNLLDYQLGFDVTFGMDKATRLDYGESQMTHAMVFTAFDEDKETGAVAKWRVENSWGKDRGHKGYLLMTDNWFSEFTYEVVVHKKYLPEETLAVLNEEPIVLSPWDPMGSLASSD